MSNLILFILSSYGLSSILIDSEIGKSIRPIFNYIPLIGKAVNKECFQCVGLWSGLACSPILWWNHWFPLSLGCGLAASAISPVLATACKWFHDEYMLNQLK